MGKRSLPVPTDAQGAQAASGQPAVCHFGLGGRENVDVRVTLPSSRVIDRAGAETDRVLTVIE